MNWFNEPSNIPVAQLIGHSHPDFGRKSQILIVLMVNGNDSNAIESETKIQIQKMAKRLNLLIKYMKSRLFK